MKSKEFFRILVLKAALMFAKCVLCVRTFLRTLLLADNSLLIKNLFRLTKKNLGSFMQVSTVEMVSTFRLMTLFVEFFG